ncbi:hypothetical protein ACMFMG_006247 [Clarireedia jacksonii]
MWMLAEAAFIQPQQYGRLQMENAFNSQYYSGFENARLVERDTRVCASDAHSCLDINATGICCPNTHYCMTSMTNSTLSPMCCPLLSNCKSPCSENSYLCSTIVTLTLTLSSSLSSFPSPTTTTSLHSTTTCCSRFCPSTNLYRCPLSLGGGCCSLSATCITSSCYYPPTSTAAAMETSSASRTGTGVGATGSADDEGDDDDDGTKKGLSTGAKAGIGIGVAGGVLLLLGLGIWYVKLHRRRAAENQRYLDEMAENSTIAHSHSVAESKRPSAGGKGGSDYFSQGKRKMGPYEEGTGTGMVDMGVGMSSEGRMHGQGQSRERGVPLTPQSPNDIVVPVEIDSTGTSPGWEGLGRGRNQTMNGDLEGNRMVNDQGRSTHVAELP